MNYSKLLQLAKGWGNFISDRIIIWRLHSFQQQILGNDCHDVRRESIGKYWIPAFKLLEDKNNVVITNPKWVKTMKDNKDDAKDSKWIGDLFHLGFVKGSYIPCRKIRIL